MDLPLFVGREAEIDAVGAALVEAGQAGGVIALYAVDGMPGIGKTALAVHVGHRLAGRFPDRQLFLDLHAHTPGQDPVRPGDALAELLAADGLDPRFLPATVQARAGMWRDRMAGRRLLLVLDNAASTEQIAPLLPGAAGALVLVTSRRRLGDLPGAIPVSLPVLAEREAAEMFVRSAPRAAAEPQTVVELVRACGYLPLAVSILASLFVRHPAWTGADLLRELHRSAGGLLTMSAESRTVAAAFDLSYQSLPADRQRFFRLLGLHPGVSIDVYAAAALTGTCLDEAAEHLDRLHHDHLLEEPAYRRYRMHDLLRGYAHTLATAADPAGIRQDSVGRLLDYYQHTAARADARLSRHTRPATTTTVGPPPAAPQVDGWEQAAAWLRVERANLIACTQHTVARELHQRTVELTAGLAALLHTDGPWPQAVELHQAAAAAAQHLGEDLAKADALYDLGGIRWLTGDHRSAADLLTRSLELYRAVGDRRGEANALLELAGVRWQTGGHPEAADLLTRSLELYRAVGDRRGEANAVLGLGNDRWLAGDYLRATELYRQALPLHRALGGRGGEAGALFGLGAVRWLTGDYPGAADLYRRALRLYQAVGDRCGEAHALMELAGVGWLTGDYPGAADLCRRALDRCRTVGYRRGEAVALDQLGILRRLAGDYRAAADLHRRALHRHQALGYQWGEAVTRTHLAVVGYLTGDYTAATGLLQQALTAYRVLGSARDEAHALNHLATVHRLTGQPEKARSHHEQALRIARDNHHRLEEAHALAGIGRATRDLRETATAAAHLQRAIAIYRHLGVPEATLATADLADLADLDHQALAASS